MAQTSPGASSVRSVPSTSIQKKLDVRARQATSISSRDDSDDDDLDGDADNGDPTDVKRARRYLLIIILNLKVDIYIYMEIPKQSLFINFFLRLS